jgi:cytochrome P450
MLKIDVINDHTFVFYLAGFETTVAMMTISLYQLALNPDIQWQVGNKVDIVLDRHGGNITYGSV